MSYPFTTLVADQYTTLSVQPQDLKGKVAIITGANTGIGLETARFFAKWNISHLILACRSLERAEKAVEDITASTGNPYVEGWELDLAEFDSVRKFAERFKATGWDLHLLVNNAGLAGLPDPTFTKDGNEMILQVNHLGNTLLTLLLLPVIQETARKAFLATEQPPRIIIVSSGVHYWSKELTRADLADRSKGDRDYAASGDLIGYLNNPASYDNGRYGLTKVFNVILTQKLAYLLTSNQHNNPDNRIIVHAIDPGLVGTELGRYRKWTLSFTILLAIFARNPVQGALTTVYAATNNVDAGDLVRNGGYFASCSRRIPKMISSEYRDWVWGETLKVLRLKESELGIF